MLFTYKVRYRTSHGIKITDYIQAYSMRDAANKLSNAMAPENTILMIKLVRRKRYQGNKPNE